MFGNKEALTQMDKFMQSFWRVVGALLALASIFAIVRIITSLPKIIPSSDGTMVDYSQLVVLLLSTVTIIFAIAAVILTILGIVGYRNLIARASKHAESQVQKKIESAFSEGGIAVQRIDAAFDRKDGKLHPWMEERIRIEVIEIIPFVVDQTLNPANNGEGMADGAATDEGEVD